MDLRKRSTNRRDQIRKWFAHATTALLLGLAFTVPATAAKDAAKSPQEVKPLLVGTTIPSVSVRTIDGKVVDLLEDARKKPSILVFYRGGW